MLWLLKWVVMFWSLPIAILLIRIFKISYLHKYWYFLSILKMQKISTCWAKEAWRDSRKHWQSFGYVVTAQMGCDVLVLAIAILSTKIFTISYLHKYWCFLSISKCKSYLLAALKKLGETLESIGQSAGYVVAAQMGCDVLVLAIDILLIKIFKISYLHKYWCFLSILKCKNCLFVELTKHGEPLESIDRALGMLWLLKWVVMFWSLLLPYC